ncbi:MAG: Asp-tRNA(Asn)/Glu-tRNA(Gln) amidotransferase GatCAB subunit A, partial [Nocardioidaceae bacterium]|nr:Asp-tRNA(Asn)/Glu-tRNA(Gln) amidotransferase GatCAB subunit A [Nocardioidaceae bacterium]
MADWTRRTAAELADALAAGEVTSVELTQAHLDRIAAVDGDVHAFLHVSDHALDVAADIDRRRAAGEQLGALAGVPLAIKDVLVTTDMPSTSGSKILEGFISPYDATVV